MEAGDLVLTSLPQADGGAKLRPTLLLCRMPGFGDWLACGISTQTRHQIAGFDEVITPTDADYAASGVRTESLIRLGQKLCTRRFFCEFCEFLRLTLIEDWPRRSAQHGDGQARREACE